MLMEAAATDASTRDQGTEVGALMGYSGSSAAAAVLADLRLGPPRNAIEADLPTEIRPPDLMSAYIVQAELREMLAARGHGNQIGWKIGCTTKVMQDYLKIPHPCAGTLYRTGLHEGYATIRAADYRQLGLECEIAVELGADLPLTDGFRGIDDVAPAVRSAMASIEIVEHRFRDFSKASVASLIADDFFSAGCVVGVPVAMADLRDLATLRGGFAIDGGRPETTGTGAEILGHPLAALAWLADHAARLGTPLREGQIVTLGSVVKTIYPKGGERIEARFTKLPPAVVEII